MQPITCNIHNRRMGAKADRRFALNFTVLLKATNIEDAKKESVMYLDGIKNGVPAEWFFWGNTINSVKNGRFVHNLRNKNKGK